MSKKRLSQLESAELVSIKRREPNRMIRPRFGHLEDRGLIRWEDGQAILTADGEAALRRRLG